MSGNTQTVPQTIATMVKTFVRTPVYQRDRDRRCARCCFAIWCRSASAIICPSFLRNARRYDTDTLAPAGYNAIISAISLSSSINASLNVVIVFLCYHKCLICQYIF